MVESLKELNRKCQKPNYKTVGNWMVRNILRDAALPMTWLLLHWKVTANQVTLASLVVGVVGLALFSFHGTAAFVAAVILFQLWYYLDHVDGQLARYYGTASLSGRFFDYMTHHIIHGVVFFTLGLYAFQKTGAVVFVVWGFISSLSIILFNLVQDTKYKTFFDRLNAMEQVSLKGKPADITDLNADTAENRSNLFRKVFSLMHKSAEVHVIMNVLTLCALLEIFLPVFDCRFLIGVLYGVITPVIAITKISFYIKTQRIDREFKVQFEEL